MTKARILVDLITKEEHVLGNYQYVKIGRAEDNNIQTNEDISTVSGNHATVYNENGQVYVWDNRSKNGTYLYEESHEDKKEIVTERILLPLNYILNLGGSYPMRLEERDLVAEQATEKRARADDTQIKKES